MVRPPSGWHEHVDCSNKWLWLVPLPVDSVQTVPSIGIFERKTVIKHVVPSNVFWSTKPLNYFQDAMVSKYICHLTVNSFNTFDPEMPLIWCYMYNQLQKCWDIPSKKRTFLLQIAASHKTVRYMYNTELPPPSHAKLFLQVLSMVVYC